jgi:hypothetical protein
LLELKLMLKKISVEQLCLGMHLQDFCGAWLDHPFWRTKFVLTDAKDIQLILESPIKEVWINISKGLDINTDDASSEPSKSLLKKSPPRHLSFRRRHHSTMR